MRSAHAPGRRRQQKFAVAIFGLRPDNSLAGSETLEGGFTRGNANTASAENALHPSGVRDEGTRDQCPGNETRL
ncbi:hypothetical protein EQG67_16395 [Kosakonia cowanii]|nr:hypothetical protein EH164_16685 [Kosakonia sp. CCTCC M2018092]QAR47225.1 hypothetical protein EQG67_16395 [Kosakonia cowanii]